MALSFKYKLIKRSDGNKVKTPSIPIVLSNTLGKLKVEFFALVDSGADLSVIPKDVADLLSISLDGKKSKSLGIGGEVDVVTTKMRVLLKKSHEEHIFDIPVQVVLNESKLPIILGRAGFFDEFKVIFEQNEERVILKKNSKIVY